jgi:molybdopterin-guanine dinucleotide biosynthesis protein A
MHGARKAFVKYKGKVFLEYALESLADFKEILIVCERAEYDAYMKWLKSYRASYKDRIRLVFDLFDDKGPVCGVCTALYSASHQYVAIAPVDMPFLKDAFYKAAFAIIQSGANATDCVLAKIDGRVYPVVGIYKGKLRLTFERALSQNQLRMMALVEAVRPVYLTEADFKADDLKKQFVNINTPDKLADLAV